MGHRVHSLTRHWPILVCVVLGCRTTTGGKPTVMSFEEKVRNLRWVCYSPSKANPDSGRVVTPEEIQADMRALKPHFDGLITYGLGLGGDAIPAIAREEGFSGFIAGVWNPFDPDELSAAVDIGRAGLFDAVCIGNEGLGSRYEWDTLLVIIHEVKEDTGLPVTTTEQIEDYEQSQFTQLDFVLANVHPLWYEYSDASLGADWVSQQAQYLVEIFPDKPVLIKESGFPSAGPPFCTEELQSNFWDLLYGLQKAGGYGLAFFEAFDQPWKHETFHGEDVGPHWGCFRVDGSPKPVLMSIPQAAPVP